MGLTLLEVEGGGVDTVPEGVTPIWKGDISLED